LVESVFISLDTVAPPSNTQVTVLDKNDPPTIGQTTLSIKENSPLGALAGNIGAVDPDVGSVLTYSLLRADTPDAFRIDATGSFIVKSAVLDFETKSSYVYKVQVSDGVNLVPADITITLLDDNDNVSGAVLHGACAAFIALRWCGIIRTPWAFLERTLAS